MKKVFGFIGLVLCMVGIGYCVAFTIVTKLSKHEARMKELARELKHTHRAEGMTHAMMHYIVGLKSEDRALIQILYGDWLFQNHCYAPYGECYLANLGMIAKRAGEMLSEAEKQKAYTENFPVKDITRWYVRQQ